MSNQESINSHGRAKDTEKIVQVIHGMSELVNAGLNPDAIRISIELLGAGMNPQALVKEIRMLKTEAKKQQQQQQ